MAYENQIKCEGCGISIPPQPEDADAAELMCDTCEISYEASLEIPQTADLTKQQILDVFRAADEDEEPHQNLYLLGLHAAVVPDWEQVVALGGYCRCNPLTGSFILDLAMKFDREHHPDVMPGGAWMNSGFSTLGDDLPEWCVELPKITYQGE